MLQCNKLAPNSQNLVPSLVKIIYLRGFHSTFFVVHKHFNSTETYLQPRNQTEKGFLPFQFGQNRFIRITGGRRPRYFIQRSGMLGTGEANIPKSHVLMQLQKLTFPALLSWFIEFPTHFEYISFLISFSKKGQKHGFLVSTK